MLWRVFRSCTVTPSPASATPHHDSSYVLPHLIQHRVWVFVSLFTLPNPQYSSFLFYVHKQLLLFLCPRVVSLSLSLLADSLNRFVFPPPHSVFLLSYGAIGGGHVPRRLYKHGHSQRPPFLRGGKEAAEGNPAEWAWGRGARGHGVSGTAALAARRTAHRAGR